MCFVFQVSLFVVGPRGDVRNPSNELLVCYDVDCCPLKFSYDNVIVTCIRFYFWHMNQNCPQMNAQDAYFK